MSSTPLEKTTLEPLAPPVAASEAPAPDLEYGWHSNNRVELLENGEA